jgi:hypothetical protein
MHRYRHHSPRAQALVGAVWMIGLGILFLTGKWWPGIMILIGLTMVLGALARGWDALETPEPPRPAPPVNQAPPPPPIPVMRVAPPAEPKPAPRPVRLPDLCPYCGAPPRSLPARNPDNPYECPYCGTDLRPA